MVLAQGLLQEATELFGAIANVEPSVENFNGPKAYQLTRAFAVSINTDDTSDSVLDRDSEYIDEYEREFQSRLEACIGDPKLKRFGKAMMNIMRDSCERLDQLRGVCERLGALLDSVTTAWVETVAAQHQSPTYPLDMLSKIWAETFKSHETPTDWIFWMDGFIAMCLSINSFMEDDHTFTIMLYSSWLAFLLSHRISDTHPAVINESIALHFSVSISSLVLNNSVFDTGGSEREEVSRCVSPVWRILKCPLSIRGLMCDEAGLEFVRKLFDRLNTFITTPEDYNALESLGDTFFDVCSEIGKSIAEPGDFSLGLHKPLWFAAWSCGSPLLFSPLLMCVHLVLKCIVTAAAGCTRPGVNNSVRLARQQYAFSMLECLVRNIPECLVGPRAFELHLLLTEDDDYMEEDGAAQNDEGSDKGGSSDNENSGGENEGDETRVNSKKQKVNKAAKRKQGYHRLLNSSLDPLLSFFTQALLLTPDKRESRDRLVSLIIGFVKYNEPKPNYQFFFVKFVTLLTQLTSGERASTRIISLELLTACCGSNDLIFDEIKDRWNWIQSLYMTRCSDVSAQVRSRALELMSQFLSFVEDRLNNSNSQVLNWLQGSEESSLDFGTLLCLLNLRVLDEKSIVRKGCVNLLHSIFSLMMKLEPPEAHSQIFQIIPTEIFHILRDDSGLLVRQKFNSFLLSLFGMFERSEDIRCFVVQNWLILAGDSEDSVAMKAKESLKLHIVDSLSNEFKIYWRQGAPETLTEFAILSLIVKLQSDGETTERFSRALCGLHVHFKSDINLLLRAITHDVPTLQPQVPLGLLKVVEICLDLLKAVEPPKTSMSLTKSLAKLLKSENPDTSVESLTVTLSILYKLVPFEDSAEVKEGLCVFIRNVLQTLHCHPSLVVPFAKLYFLLLPDQATYREEISRLVQVSRKHLSSLRPSASNQQCISPTHAAAVIQLAGMCYVLGSRIPSSNRVAQYLKEIAEPMATTMLSLACNAFKKTTSLSHTPGVCQDENTPEMWLEDVPYWLRAVAMTSASQILLNHEGVAKRLIIKLMEAGTRIGRNDPGTIISNLAFATFDFALKMTSVMDPYFPLMSSFIGHPHLPSVTRLHILALLFQLTAQDFLKPRGLVTYHFLSALGDPDEDIQLLAEQGVQSVLKPRVRDLFFMNMLEMVCFTTGFFTHPEIKCALDVHPICAEMCDATAVCVKTFDMSQNESRRLATYSAMLGTAGDHSKHLVTLKILSSFLAPFGNTRGAIRTAENQIEFPVDRSSPSGLAMSDVLRLLSCAEFKLTFTQSQTRTNKEATEDLVEGGEENEKLEREGKAKEDRQITKEFLKQAVLPNLQSLRKVSQTAKSALQKDIYECIARLLYDYRSELDDMIGDPHLIRLLKRSYEDVQTREDEDPDVDKTYEEYFLHEFYGAKYSRRPLQTLDQTIASRRSSVIQLNSPQTVAIVNSVTPRQPPSVLVLTGPK